MVAAALGCSGPSQQTAETELSFGEQLELVKSGKSETIHVEAAPVGDDQLALLRGVTGLKALQIDRGDSPVTVEGLRHLATLENLEHFRCRAAGINDDALAEIAKITSLQILNLPRADAATDAGLRMLDALPNLVQLRIASPQVSDEGMEAIARFPGLKRLHLINVPLTGKGLQALAKMEQLESLYIDGGNFTDADVDALFAARPQLHVHFNQQHHDRDPHGHAH